MRMFFWKDRVRLLEHVRVNRTNTVLENGDKSLKALTKSLIKSTFKMTL